MGANDVSDSDDEKPIKRKSSKTPKAKALPVIGTISLDDIGDDEIFVVKVPVEVNMDHLHDCDLTVRDGNILKFKEREFVSVIDEEQLDVSVILSDSKGRPCVQAYQIEGCVTLVEHIVVPEVPPFVIPPRYIVPAPQGLRTRHPIYGRDLEFGHLRKSWSPTNERKSENVELNNNEKGSGPQKIIKIIEEPSEDKAKKRKKKKNKEIEEELESPSKKKKSEDLEEIEIKKEPSEDKAKKNKKKNKDKEEDLESQAKKRKSEDLEEIEIKEEPSEDKSKKHKKKKKKDKGEDPESLSTKDLEVSEIKEEPSEDQAKKHKKKKKKKDIV